MISVSSDSEWAVIKALTEAMINYKYPPELANVLLDDHDLPAYKEAHEAAKEAYYLVNIDGLITSMNRAVEERNKALTATDEANHEARGTRKDLNALLKLAKVREDLIERGEALTFEDTEILRDTDPDNWVARGYDLDDWEWMWEDD